MAVLNVFKLGFKVDKGCGLIVDGGGWWNNGARRAQEGKAGHGGLGVAAAPEVGDEVVGCLGRAGYEARWAGVVGWWARRLGPTGRPRPKEWASRLGWKRKEKGKPLKIDFLI
jgi:hypothetical protein